MLTIGERINVRTKVLGEAMAGKDFGPIKEMAIKQVEAGAKMLDINIGPARKNGPELMEWLVKSIQEVVDVPLSLDTTNADAMEAGLKVHKGKALINSASAEPERLAKMMPLAKKYNANIIALTLAKGGLPRDANERCALAAEIMAAAMEHEVPLEDIYLDPIMVVINGQQEHIKEVFEAIKMFKDLNDPPMKSVVGLSNVSNGAPAELRPILNRVTVAMGIAYGLDAAIVDPLEEGMMEAVKTADVLLNKTLYCHSYLNM